MSKLTSIQRCVALDLEVSVQTGRIKSFAAVRGDTLEILRYSAGGAVVRDLMKLDEFVGDALLLVGHNIIAFDLPHLKAVAPRLRLLRLPPLDTLRLSPLAFPSNPYHRLVKHYKDGALLREMRNDPALDARICLELLIEEAAALGALRESDPDLLCAWHWLFSLNPEDVGFAAFLDELRGLPRPDAASGIAAIARKLRDIACVTAVRNLLNASPVDVWAVAYALAWLSVAGGNSVMPPWVRHEFPEAGHLVRRLRDRPCDAPDCPWCAEHHNPKRMLQRWFGFSAFRPEPACDDGRSMQEAIVAASMAGEHVLGILPTGTGKSVCYQIPALSRYENTGALTIVISPLVALMADQAYGLEARGITGCAALNGLLSMPERTDILDKIRLGDIAILLVAPEQLRNRGFRRAVAQREIGAWVLDEAHCLSKWGHDFRTDYRYVGRFIKESAGKGPLPPVLCLTATAKPDVVADIRGYFLQTLGVDIIVFDGGANRSNLDFVVVETTPAHKMADIDRLLEHSLPTHQPGGAIIYCATRKQTERIAAFLVAKGWDAAHFHAGLQPETKKNTQRRFILGELRVIAATNAFGMGIDKPDVRLVLHVEMPGSLENYVQEAGRAGRDQDPARCVLLYCEKDIEQQFGLTALSRLPHHEIKAVLRALRRLAGKRRPANEAVEVVATPGEILAEDVEKYVLRDSHTDDTRVRTAVAWLEEARLVRREENRYQVFPSTLRVSCLDEAWKRLDSIPNPYQGQLRAIVTLLMQADPDEGVTTDELMGASRLSSSGVSRALYDLDRLGIVSNDSTITALVHVGIENASRKRLESADAMETAIINVLREVAPDLEKGGASVLYLRRISQRLKDDGFEQALPGRVYRLLESIAADGRSEGQGIGSLRLKKIDAEAIHLILNRDWEPLQRTAKLRTTAARLLLDHLLSKVPDQLRGTDLLAETTIGNLHRAVEADLEVTAQVKEVGRLVERALLWLHEQEVLRLGKGFVVFRPAMNIQVAPGKTPFTREDYTELEDHYNEQIVQIHVMAEYARRGLLIMRDAMQLAADYFRLNRESFIHRWFPQALKELTRQTTDESWRAIVESLSREQRAIVTDNREQTSVLVLAGPGSGKTRVLVHRIAYLVRVRRENPRGILALAYNRHAAVEIRQRLRALIDDDANGVTVLTCHALAMRLTGVSFADRSAVTIDFTQVLEEAARLLRGDDLDGEDADEQRCRLLAGFRWILVDEYQDVGREQYELISALAGRTLKDKENRLSLFAVGDDDQNIYSFAGASVVYIRRFQEDYQALPVYLIENYRSTEHIVHTANALMEPARKRMKREHPIRVDEARKTEPKGGLWEAFDPVSKGRVQLVKVGRTYTEQAAMVMGELRRLAALDPEWDWNNVAVVAREWRLLEPVYAYCVEAGVPVQRADQELPPFRRWRETRRLMEWLSSLGVGLIDPDVFNKWLQAQPSGPWRDLLEEAASNYWVECGDEPLPAAHFREWLAEWGHEIRRRRRGIMLLTAHRVKGLEFDHVVVLDGGWEMRDRAEDRDAARRLYYVAMTRARRTLTLAQRGDNPLTCTLAGLPSVCEREAPAPEPFSPALERIYQLLTPKDVDLGFAGRQASYDPVHDAIARLQPGDPLELVPRGKAWFLYSKRQEAGRLASGYAPPPGMCCIEARVHAILVWTRNDGEPDYADSMRNDQWEVVLPELIFAPNKTE